ncbi:MAG: BamA/TamA family outer membrane protein [Deltaproteobacteria bacterium]|nr:BamA/TamA family outer membrane protein [Deltaproteobacteria bacterium]
MIRLVAVVLVVLGARISTAQSQPQAGDDDTVPAVKFDPASCIQAVDPVVAPTDVSAPPPTWNDFDVTGELRDARATVRALLEPTMTRQQALTETAREQIRAVSGAFGYHLVGIGLKEAPAGTVAIIHLSPLPMVRKVDVDVDQSIFDTLSSPILDDEVRRRMRVRTGSYLPWSPHDRACVLHEEKLRIEEFLREEGFIEATVDVQERRKGTGIALELEVHLGPEYTAGLINIADREPNNVSDDEIRSKFRHTSFCIVGKGRLCFGSARFKRTRHQADIQAVVELFRQRGYPAVRVRTDFDPMTSFDRRTKNVNFTITIDQRRRLEVVFEGHSEAVTIDNLKKQLTFDQAASADDVEAHESAKALAAYLQGRGFFDARVTWTRERFEPFDRIVFRIDQGATRQVRSIQFVGNRALDASELLEVIGTREARFSSSLFGSRTAATSVQLAADVEALVDTYRRAGYREARVRVSAATEPAALDSAALAASLVLAGRGNGLHVRYTIDEGLPTLLTQVEVALGDKGDTIVTPEQRALCKLVLADLATLHGEPQLATPAADNRCVATAANLKYREAEAIDTRDRLRDRLYSHGRPRAKVGFVPKVLGPHRIAIVYKLTDVQPLTIGKIVIRGNFRTRSSIILDELRGPSDEAGFREGRPLTKDALAESARRLRNTGLFEAVNISMPDLDNTSEGSVNAVVEVTERYDFRAQVEAEGGVSSYNGTFVRLTPTFKNLFGLGISLDISGTVGVDLVESVETDELKLRQLAAESTLRIPQWLTRNVFPDLFAPQIELTAFHRRQDTPRFGVITTDGVTLGFARTWQRQRIGPRPARALTAGVHYDFRLRERPVDVLRPIGADDDQTQVPIRTRTGSIGITGEWEQRVDRAGTLSPLAAEDGFRLEGQFSFASPNLGGQDTFIKVSAAGSRYWPVGDHLVLRFDLRYDQGFPLAGAVLLPEVERFFAGGDSTVRGYEDDRLATEVIKVGVPPFDNAQQIRILPAGGNIRVMSSVDAQLRIWKLLATAAFIDAGMITNQWGNVTEDDIRPSIGVALIRVVTPFGTGALERAMPLRPHLGDNPRGRWHLSFAARAQF